MDNLLWVVHRLCATIPVIYKISTSLSTGVASGQLRYPFYGSRQMMRHLACAGVAVGRHRVRRLTRLLGPEEIYGTAHHGREPASPCVSLTAEGLTIE